jgi:hypothetical protein
MEETLTTAIRDTPRNPRPLRNGLGSNKVNTERHTTMKTWKYMCYEELLDAASIAFEETHELPNSATNHDREIWIEKWIDDHFNELAPICLECGGFH